MMDLSKRSHKKELLDDPSIPFADIKQNMRELNVVNTLLGGHRITISGIKQLLVKRPSENTFTVCEIGCGGGDNLKAIARWCAQHNILVHCIGIDMKPECIEYAKQQCEGINATWIVSDYRYSIFKEHVPDIIFSSLFCHHFEDDDLKHMLRWMKHHSLLGFLVNDLHRHPVAYYAIKMLTAFFSKSYLVKNDAPLSVARGFKKKEWEKIFASAGISADHISWKWAFRHLIICYND